MTDYPTRRARALAKIALAVDALDGTNVNTWRLRTDLLAAFERNAPRNGTVKEATNEQASSGTDTSGDENNNDQQHFRRHSEGGAAD